VQTGLNELFLEVNFWELVKNGGTVTWAVLGTLALFSLASWTIIFSKWSAFRRARNANLRFLRAFRKSTRLDAVAAATEQFRAAPLVATLLIPAPIQPGLRLQESKSASAELAPKTSIESNKPSMRPAT